MANAGPNQNGFQFVICMVKIDGLEWQAWALWQGERQHEYYEGHGSFGSRNDKTSKKTLGHSDKFGFVFDLIYTIPFVPAKPPPALRACDLWICCNSLDSIYPLSPSDLAGVTVKFITVK